MSSEDTSDDRPSKRVKRDTSYKNKAFEKFKQLKSGQRKKYEVEDIDSIYETVDEKEYTNRVLARQDDDWIVDDDGSGYVEDGREIFDDDLDAASILEAQKNSKKGKKGTKRKLGVSENAGKGNLQYMLSNIKTKKKEETTVGDDDILSELLGEIDETPTTSKVTPKPKPIPKRAIEKKVVNDYMKTFNTMKPIKKPTNSILKEKPIKQNVVVESNKNGRNNFYSTQDEYEDAVVDGSSTESTEELLKKANNILAKPVETKLQKSNEVKERPLNRNSGDDSGIDVAASDSKDGKISEETSIGDDFFDDCFEDFTEPPTLKIEESGIEGSSIEGSSMEESFEDFDDECFENSDLESEFMSQWQRSKDQKQHEVMEVDLDKADIPLVEVDDQKVFRFFWWDAFEAPNKFKGTVYLFGKTYSEKSKSYVSCCVAVQNIDRRVYVLPRKFMLDDNNKPTDTPVTYKDVYTEFHNLVVKPMGISEFKTRYVTKKYPFSAGVPLESDYLEVRYQAKDPEIEPFEEIRPKPRTFVKIFGRNTSYLERLLLDRKLKGPCWLDITSPVPVTNPVSWCQYEVNCMSPINLKISALSKPLPPPPMVVSAINLRSAINPKTDQNEVVMITCVSHTHYAVDKKPPVPNFQQHFCVFTSPQNQIMPVAMHKALEGYKATKVQKMDSEQALLNYFINQFSKLDADLIVGHDLEGYQINLLCDRLGKYQIKSHSKMSRIKRSNTFTADKKYFKQFFTGRLVCDIKISAKELIKSRSYDLDALCKAVLNIGPKQRVDLEPEDVPRMFQTSEGVLKLISLTMQDTAFILKIMYDLNTIPLALQITNIAGNIMSKTLMGGRSERNEFLLLHAFNEKGYIVADKEYGYKRTTDNGDYHTNQKLSQPKRKKPTYSGGLVLEPKTGFYDNFILLMDFNSLYPSIIQEYNICFTTLPPVNSKDDEDINLTELPDSSLPQGILPIEIRKLVESRREVKKLMNDQDISNDLRMQYHIRQMALKLTANSMYGCLGFSNSRFYAKNLAALVTQKGREILTNTRDLVQRMSFEVVYGDTDSIMINTNSVDYDQVMKVGLQIKQEVNKLYKQVELDIDGVFKYLLLLKKKKYAAVTLSKMKNGELKTEKEYKGLDIVRRDWSQLASEAGKFILEFILSDQTTDERIENIQAYLSKVKTDLEENKVPLQLLVITKQLTKNPKMYTDKNSLAHVQVALRYNQKSGGHLRAGDTVPYVICVDGTDKGYNQRAYHIEEMKNSKELKIDVPYYLSQQLLPVISRICEPIEGIDESQIAEYLGIDSYKRNNSKGPTQTCEGPTKKQTGFSFRNAAPFTFKCVQCKTDNVIDKVPKESGKFFLNEACQNKDCNARPASYVQYISNQLGLQIKKLIKNYYKHEMICEDPACSNDTRRIPRNFAGKYPVCTMCQNGVMYLKVTSADLYSQLLFFLHMFDLDKLDKRPKFENAVESGYYKLKETIEKYLSNSAFSVINLEQLFSLVAQLASESISIESQVLDAEEIKEVREVQTDEELSQ